MLTIGPQLYQLTPKDAATLQLEPFSDNASFTLGPAVINGSYFSREIPGDRALYLQGAGINVQASFGDEWTNISMFWVRDQTSFAPSNINLLTALNLSLIAGLLEFDYQNFGVAGGAGTISVRQPVLLPPGGVINYVVQRVGAAGATTSTAFVHGWLIPAANLGRLN